VIEGTVGEGREAVLQVHLQHVDVVADALEHLGVVDLARRSRAPGASARDA
jgi:hypothetical protein